MITLFSLRGTSEISILELAYNSRIENEIIESGHTQSHDSFNRALKKLQGSYLNVRIGQVNYSIYEENQESETIVSFVNPSISDFLINHIKQSQNERGRLISGALFLDQITNLFHPNLDNYIKFNEGETEKHFTTIVKKKDKLKAHNKKTNYQIYFLKTLNELFNNLTDIELIIEHFKLIDHNNIDSWNFSNYIYILNIVSGIPFIDAYLKKDWTEIILNLYDVASNDDDFNKIYFLFEEYNEDYNEFISIPDNEEVMISNIKVFLSDVVEDTIKENIETYTYTEENVWYEDENGSYISADIVFVLDQDIDDIIDEHFELFQDYAHHPFLSDIYIDSKDLNINTNNLKEFIEKSYNESMADTYDKSEYRESISNDEKSETEIIDDLFDK